MPSDNPIAANPDDSTGYRRGGKPRPPERGGTGRLLGLNVVLAILVAGLVVSGWFVANQHQQLNEAERLLGEADQRLIRLEERLQMTDQTMSAAGDEVQDQLGFWEDEIRKVWDVANKRNKNWIVENQSKLKRQAARLANIDASLTGLKSSVSRHDQAFGQQREMLDQLAALDLQIRQVAEQQRRMTDQLNAARQGFASLESGLERRVANNEEAVEAIDAYRVQLNNRLNDLRRRMETLHGVPVP
jgi:chromosome segregation ATPase